MATVMMGADSEFQLGGDKTVTVTSTGWTFIGKKKEGTDHWGRVQGGKGIYMSPQAFVALMDKANGVGKKMVAMMKTSDVDTYDFHISGKVYIRLTPYLNSFLLCRMYVYQGRLYTSKFQACYLNASQWAHLVENGQQLIATNSAMSTEQLCYKQQPMLKKRLHFRTCVNCNPWSDERVEMEAEEQQEAAVEEEPIVEFRQEQSLMNAAYYLDSMFETDDAAAVSAEVEAAAAAEALYQQTMIEEANVTKPGLLKRMNSSGSVKPSKRVKLITAA